MFEMVVIVERLQLLTFESEAIVKPVRLLQPQMRQESERMSGIKSDNGGAAESVLDAHPNGLQGKLGPALRHEIATQRLVLLRLTR